MSEKMKFDIIRIKAGTVPGVNIPFVLAIPKKLKDKSKIVLTFNNENGISLDESTYNIESNITKIIELLDIDLPIAVAILPSTKEFNESLQSENIDLQVGESKQFARECFDSKIPADNRFYRLDKQVNSMIKAILTSKSLRERIQEIRCSSDTLEFNDKITGFGHSGAGAAMLRYALIQPDLFDTLIIGGNGDIVPTPFGENGKRLGYPFGVEDYFELFGKDFSEKAYKSISFQFYIGDKEDTKTVYDTIRDENYSSNGSGSMFAPESLAKIYKKMYGNPFFERFKNVLKQYEDADAKIGLKIYENDCHSMIRKQDLHRIIDDGISFNHNCSEQIQLMLDGRSERNK